MERGAVAYTTGPDPGGGGGGRARSAPLVLLVDDEQAIRAICRVNLEGDGFSVLEAKDGAEALGAIKRQRPSLVLLDVMMPGVDGWSVAARLAATRKRGTSPWSSCRLAPRTRIASAPRSSAQWATS